VRRMLEPCWGDIEVVSDLAGIPRVLAATQESGDSQLVTGYSVELPPIPLNEVRLWVEAGSSTT